MNIFAGKSVVICDYPSKYLFPPKGYGGIERWLWTVAVASVNLGMRVILLGPNWRYKLLPQAEYFSDSIINITIDDFLSRIGHVDFLVGGHEYWLNKIMINKFDKIANFSLTYQHGSSPLYEKNTFNNKNRFLFCYSDEMEKIFFKQHPTKLLCTAAGAGEAPIKTDSKNYLISIGRMDVDKSPHYAILAANQLNLPIYVLGENIKKDGYLEKFKKVFNSPQIYMKGVISGREKMKLIAGACCGVYTKGPDYIEPAAGTIAEIIRSGVPLVGISWSGNDAVCEPINLDNKLGYIAKCNKEDTEDAIVGKLVEAIKLSMKLNRDYIFEKGNSIYNQTELVKQMYLRAINS